MGEQRQRYNDEFKKQAVKYVQEQTKTLPEIGKELNIPAGTKFKTRQQAYEAIYRYIERKRIHSAICLCIAGSICCAF